MALQYQNGVYDITKPWTQPPAWTYLRPWATNMERLTQQALDSALMSRTQVADMVRPPVPSQLFPPRYGWRQRTLNIGDIMGVDRVIDQSPDPNFEGPAGYIGASRYSLGEGVTG